MASATSTIALPQPRALPWPEASQSLASQGWRWLLRAAFAAPLVLVAALAAAHGFRDGANTALVAHARAIRWGARDLSFVRSVYPPVPSVIARLVPNAGALGIVGALAGGVFLEAVHHRLRCVGMPRATALVLVATLAVSPGFALTATADLATFLALTLIALALDGFARFVHHGNTHGGFRAGLALGLAGLCHPGAIVVAVGFAAAAPLIAHYRYRGRRAAGRATAGVLLFPTVAGLLSWTFLCWRFAHSPLVWLHSSAPALFRIDGIGSVASHAVSGMAKPMMLTPVFSAVLVIAMVYDGALSALGLLVPVVASMVALGLGIGFSGGALAALLGVLALGSLSRRLTPAVTGVLIAIGVVGLAMKWTVASSPLLHTWEHALLRR